VSSGPFVRCRLHLIGPHWRHLTGGAAGPDAPPSDAVRLYGAACIRGGLHSDLLGETGGWEPKLWTYAVSAVVLYIRAAADRTSLPVPQVALKVADGLGLPLPAATPSD
jgi:hypothetical protein